METRKPNSGCASIILWTLVVGFAVFVVLLTGCEHLGQKPTPEVYAWCEDHSENSSCAWLLAERAEDQKIARWLSNAQPWFAGFLALATLAGLVWYLTAFSRLANLGYRGTQLCGSEKEFRKLLAQIDRDNEERMRGALSAAAFGMERGDER